MLPEIRDHAKIESTRSYLVYGGVGRRYGMPQSGREVWGGSIEGGITVRDMMSRYRENIAVFGPLPTFVADNVKPCNCEDEKAAIGVATAAEKHATPPANEEPQKMRPAREDGQRDLRFQAAYERAAAAYRRVKQLERADERGDNTMMLVIPATEDNAAEGLLCRRGDIGLLNPGTYFMAELRQFVVPNPNARLVG